MARTFATGSKALATITGADSGDWTILAWVNATDAGQSNAGVIFGAEDAVASVQKLLINDVSLHLDCEQTYLTSSAFTVTNQALTTGVWTLLAATFTASDKKCRVYIGTLSSPVAEATYSSQAAGSGTRRTGGVTASIGNFGPAPGSNQAFHGGVGRSGFFARLLRLDEMEAFRLGWLPTKDGTERGLWLLDSPTASQVEDRYGAANATATSLTVAEDPPVPTWQSFGTLVLAGAAAPLVVGQAVETDMAFAITATQSVAVGQATETDTAFAVTVANKVLVARVVETDAANAVSPVLMIGRAVETDTAHVIRPVSHATPTAFLPPGITRPGRAPLPRRA